MSNVKAKFVICILQSFCTIIILPFDLRYSDDTFTFVAHVMKKVKINMLKFAFGTLHHFHTQNEVSLLYFAGTKINVFDIVATRAPKISDLRAQSKFW